MAIVTNIQGYSIHDGPGIRTTVFLKGCPLRCRWCANPENLESTVQVGFNKSLCQSCFRCMDSCPEGAIVKGEYRIRRDKCTACGLCAGSCYPGALIKYGEEMTAEETFKKVRRDKMFYDSSSGGVTVSGGEPLLHPEFVKDLFTLCKGEGINTCIETCGFVGEEAFKSVLPATDWFYFDLKLIDGEKHREYTGQDNAPILRNARFLAENGANILFRQPLIPGVNDDPESVRRAAEFIKSLGGCAIQLMPYHRMGLSKYEALGKEYLLAGLDAMTLEAADKVKELYISYGVNCTVSH